MKVEGIEMPSLDKRDEKMFILSFPFSINRRRRFSSGKGKISSKKKSKIKKYHTIPQILLLFPQIIMKI
jgi:hypothetical protein